MTIRKEFRVVVDIPQAVWDAFGQTLEYSFRSCEATRDHLEAGSCFYDAPYEWAVFDSFLKAVKCEEKLNAMVRHFQSILPEKEDEPE